MANAKQPEQEEEKKKSGFLKYIILVVLLIALAGGGYFAYVKFFAKPPAVAEAPADAKTDEAAPKAEEKPAPAKEEKKAEAGHETVEATDGKVGRVDGVLLDRTGGHVTHLILRQGHLWGAREVLVPAGLVARFEDGRVILSVDKAAISARVAATPEA